VLSCAYYGLIFIQKPMTPRGPDFVYGNKVFKIAQKIKKERPGNI